ncbi:hypothetical protein B9Z55_022687 [Caenorhabditis nigoni]|nr:hypothetical protein B9Z55_022687 [Caenorhabditis nigoni]
MRRNDSNASACSTDGMYEPSRQVLNYRHIEQINTIVFHLRELSRLVTTQIGVIPNTVVGQLRSLNQRIMDNIELIEGDMARNERAPFEAKLEYYHTEYQEMLVLYQELMAILYNIPPPPPPSEESQQQ